MSIGAKKAEIDVFAEFASFDQFARRRVLMSFKDTEVLSVPTGA